jgi:hypothetical protein
MEYFETLNPQPLVWTKSGHIAGHTADCCCVAQCTAGVSQLAQLLQHACIQRNKASHHVLVCTWQHAGSSTAHTTEHMWSTMLPCKDTNTTETKSWALKKVVHDVCMGRP